MAGFASCDPRCGAGRRDGAPVAQGARREACEGRGRTADECEASQRGPGTGPGLGSALGRTRYNQIKS